MSTPAQINDAERQELLALYQVTTQDLAFFKGQQWAITNYALVAFGAIVGVTQLAHIYLSPCFKLLLGMSAVLAGVLSLLVLWKLKQSISERRDRLDRIFLRLSLEFQNARGTKPQVSAGEMFGFLCVLIVLGFSLTIWLLIGAAACNA